MELFKNMIYEYKKGMRDLVLHTCDKKSLKECLLLLEKLKIKHCITELSKDKVNLFFGNPSCLEIIAKFSNTELNKITPQEDFILGIMLGYSREEQYNRILAKI